MEENKTVQNLPDGKARNRKRFKGVVVSDAMDKTVVVLVSRYTKHPKYEKYQNLNKRYKAHDEENIYKVGDRVVIEEVRPISKDKKFKVISK